MKDKFMTKCDCCGTEFQYGPHKYDGEYIPRYQITVCMSCYDGNWDGWAPQDKWLIKHLESKNLPIPKRNRKGCLPRD